MRLANGVALPPSPLVCVEEIYFNDEIKNQKKIACRINEMAQRACLYIALLASLTAEIVIFGGGTATPFLFQKNNSKKGRNSKKNRLKS